MEQLEDMQALWNELNNRVSMLEAENQRLSRQIRHNDFKSAQDKLEKKYKGFIIVEIIMTVYICLFVSYNPLIVEKYRIPTFIYWLSFFAIEIIFDIYLLYRLKKINVYESTVKEISRLAAENWKLHKLGVIIGLPIAIGAVILFGLLLGANTFTVMGIIVGAIVGIIIGLRQLFKFADYYRLLQPDKDDLS